MRTLLESLINTQVRIAQTGDAGIRGKLVNVQSDYATVLTEKKQLVHYPYTQIKSIGSTITELPRSVEVPDVEFPPTFSGLMRTMLKQLVKIENGDDSEQGVLSTVTDEHAGIFVSPKEVMYYQLNQIKNISPVMKVMAGFVDNSNTSLATSGDAIKEGARYVVQSQRTQSQTGVVDPSTKTTSTMETEDISLASRSQSANEPVGASESAVSQPTRETFASPQDSVTEATTVLEQTSVTEDVEQENDNVRQVTGPSWAGGKRAKVYRIASHSTTRGKYKVQKRARVEKHTQPPKKAPKSTAKVVGISAPKPSYLNTTCKVKLKHAN